MINSRRGFLGGTAAAIGTMPLARPVMVSDVTTANAFIAATARAMAMDAVTG
jgi:hypothetical protein